MSNKSFMILAGVGAVCIVAIAAIGGCVRHITSEICALERDMPGE